MQHEDDDPTGYADYISDGVFFLLCVAIAATVTYGLVMLLRPDVWLAL